MEIPQISLLLVAGDGFDPPVAAVAISTTSPWSSSSLFNDAASTTPAPSGSLRISHRRLREVSGSHAGAVTPDVRRGPTPLALNVVEGESPDLTSPTSLLTSGVPRVSAPPVLDLVEGVSSSPDLTSTALTSSAGELHDPSHLVRRGSTPPPLNLVDGESPELTPPTSLLISGAPRVSAPPVLDLVEGVPSSPDLTSTALTSSAGKLHEPSPYSPSPAGLARGLLPPSSKTLADGNGGTLTTTPLPARLSPTLPARLSPASSWSWPLRGRKLLQYGYTYGYDSFPPPPPPPPAPALPNSELPPKVVVNVSTGSSDWTSFTGPAGGICSVVVLVLAAIQLCRVMTKRKKKKKHKQSTDSESSSSSSSEESGAGAGDFPTALSDLVNAAGGALGQISFDRAPEPLPDWKAYAPPVYPWTDHAEAYYKKDIY